MSNRTEISTLGEFGLIRHLTDKIELKNPSTLKGVGDDAAVLDYTDKQVLVTTDLLLEGIHFDLMYVPLKHLGYKSAVVNFSDIYAMNGRPKQITVSLGISKRFCVEDLEEFYEGIKLACDIYDVDLVGGDTSASRTGLAPRRGRKRQSCLSKRSQGDRSYLRVRRFRGRLHGSPITGTGEKHI